MSKKYLAAVGQMCSTESMTNNVKQCQILVEKASEAGAKALFLPEAADYIGSSPDETVSLAQPVHKSPFIQSLQSLASKHSICINVGIHEPTQPPSQKILNSLLWISSTGHLLEATRYTKLHLFNLDLSAINGPIMKESNTTLPGTTLTPPLSGADCPFNDDLHIGSQICFDLRFPEPALQLRRLGAKVLLYPSAFTVPTGRMGHWEVLLRARAIENQCYVVAAAQCGRHNMKRVSYGESMVVDPQGKVLGRCGRVESEHGKDEVVGGREVEIFVFEVDGGLVEEARMGIPLERRVDVYPEV